MRNLDRLIILNPAIIANDYGLAGCYDLKECLRHTRVYLFMYAELHQAQATSELFTWCTNGIVKQLIQIAGCPANRKIKGYRRAGRSNGNARIY